MTAGQWAALAIGVAAILGTFFIITDIDEFCDRLTGWSDDEKAVDDAGGDERSQRPLEHNTRT
jgi:hypothetical protein